MKKVSYREYCKAARELREQLGMHVMIVDMGSTLDRPEIQMGVNWSALGTVPAEEAVEFAAGLLKAAWAAKEFKYNGYQIDYRED